MYFLAPLVVLCGGTWFLYGQKEVWGKVEYDKVWDPERKLTPAEKETTLAAIGSSLQQSVQSGEISQGVAQSRWKQARLQYGQMY